LPSPAERLNTLPAYPFAAINQRVRELNAQGKDVISLDVGSPDLPPPELVVEALNESAHDPHKHGYSGYKGTSNFREAVAGYYQRRFGVNVNPETQVLPLLGSKEGIVNLSLAYLDRGDSTLVPDIGYPSYSMGALLAGASVTWFPLREDTGYLANFDELGHYVTGETKLLWLNYPNNPIGAVANADFYQRAVHFCRRHNLILASDNPYVEVTYDGYQAGSVLQANGALNCTVEFISLSKTYNMAGWRLGAAVGSADVISVLLQVKSNFDSGHFAAVYDAGIAALEAVPQSWIDQRNAVYQRRRDRILAALPKIGLSAQKPAGALYIWCKVQDTTMDGAAYVEQALINAHVSMAQGAMYGPGGEQFVRMCVCTTDTRLEEALERLQRWYLSQ
jgi:LL-diaminopimelate aminotransferase